MKETVTDLILRARKWLVDGAKAWSSEALMFGSKWKKEAQRLEKRIETALQELSKSEDRELCLRDSLQRERERNQKLLSHMSSNIRETFDFVERTLKKPSAEQGVVHYYLTSEAVVLNPEAVGILHLRDVFTSGELIELYWFGENADRAGLVNLKLGINLIDDFTIDSNLPRTLMIARPSIGARMHPGMTGYVELVNKSQVEKATIWAAACIRVAPEAKPKA